MTATLGRRDKQQAAGTDRCRAGEALGLRHEDVAAAEQEISIVSRENANGARAKSGGRVIPVGPDLIRLYGDYLHDEYGGIDSDHVFVNIWAEPKGHAWSYQAAYDLVLRLRARTGIAFDLRWFRHFAATRWQMSRVASDATFGGSRERALPAVQRATPGQAPDYGSLCTQRDLGCHHPVAPSRTMMQPVRLHQIPG
jgi:integrase